MTTTTPTATVVQRYLAAWNASDPAERRAATEAVFAPDARYVDPLADVTGTEALDAAQPCLVRGRAATCTSD